ncbi:hypothetical protein WJX72_012234 [[Myrmecia] bisecta]|uniref:Uncharacterized protein n=1 Tax=[Myrmecia] bisecta TaxID=41462 RepID=A0AAW1P3V5_9CHLO
MPMSPLGFDTLAALTLLATALIGAYAPVWLEARGRKLGQGRSLAYVLGNMLSAGVMISAGFVHLLGEAMFELNHVSTFPLAPFLCAVGYIITLLADHFAEGMAGGQGHGCDHGTALAAIASIEKDSDADLRHVVVGGDVEHGLTSAMPTASSQRRAKLQPKDPLQIGPAQGSPRVPQRSPKVGRQASSDKSGLLNGAIRTGGKARSVEGASPRHARAKARKAAAGAQQVDFESRQHLLERERDRAALVDDDEPLEVKESCRDNPGGSSAPTPAIAALNEPQVSFVTAVLMAVALCVHSLLEGAALGAQASIAQSLHIFIAILAHKGLAAYALGSSIVDSKADTRKYWTVIAVFALATPVGIFIGYILHSVTNNDFASAISALASGTFLYVAMMEVIPKELEQPDNRRLKLFMLLLGFAAMSLLAVWA